VTAYELDVRPSTRAVWKVTSSELLTKQEMRKNVLYTKNTYILKLLLNIVTATIEALVLGISFCMLVSKKSATCELSHILTPSISSLLLMCCDYNQFFR
jgi:hypothetical protein